jgi:hypothetical protein
MPDTEDNEDITYVTGMADRLKLTGEDRAKYIHEHMTGLGYKPRTSYHREDDDKSGNANRFGMGRRRASGDNDGW